MTEAAGPTAHVNHSVEDLCSVDGMLQYIRDCTFAEPHIVMEDSSWNMTVDELKASLL